VFGCFDEMRGFHDTCKCVVLNFDTVVLQSACDAMRGSFDGTRFFLDELQGSFDKIRGFLDTRKCVANVPEITVSVITDTVASKEPCISSNRHTGLSRYGVATVRRIDKIIELFCRISSLL